MKYIILILTDQDAFFRRLIKENIIYFHKFSIKIKSNVQIDFHIYTIFVVIFEIYGIHDIDIY